MKGRGKRLGTGDRGQAKAGSFITGKSEPEHKEQTSGNTAL